MQETSAIEICSETYEILDVFHELVQVDKDVDAWARDHVHGLNEDWLSLNGWKFENSLVTVFKSWLKSKNFVLLFGNNPTTERRKFNINMCDLHLPPWVDRQNKPYHILAKKFKELNVAFLGKSCHSLAHSKYLRPAPCANQATFIAKWNHGYHCALYDCYELYLHFLLNE